jgi:methylenetetrahydrofolate reductase (NADPH)
VTSVITNQGSEISNHSKGTQAMSDSHAQPEYQRVAEQGFAELADEQSQAVLGLLRNGSIELSTNGRDSIMSAAEILPPGMAIYVPKMPSQTLADKLTQIKQLHEFGLDPVPHIAARQMASEQELRSFLNEAVSEGHVHRVLIIGGNDAEVAGPFPDSAAVLASGILAETGLREVDVAGYPDGHPGIPTNILFADIEKKVRLTNDQDLKLNVVTQFSFAPHRVVEYCKELALRVPGVPVYAGLAGPTSPATLLRFARICGVSMSLRAVSSLGINAIKLATHSSPDKQFAVLARHSIDREKCNLAGIHLFSFGGFLQSADWIGGKLQQAHEKA